MVTSSFASQILYYIKHGSYSSSNLNCWLGLSTTNPTYDGSKAVEPSSSTGYERINIGEKLGDSLTWDEENQVFVVKNTSEINFPHALSAVNGITHWAIYTSKTATTALIYGAFDSTVNLAINEVFTISKNDLVIKIV